MILRDGVIVLFSSSSPDCISNQETASVQNHQPSFYLGIGLFLPFVGMESA